MDNSLSDRSQQIISQQDKSHDTSMLQDESVLQFEKNQLKKFPGLKVVCADDKKLNLEVMQASL